MAPVDPLANDERVSDEWIHQRIGDLIRLVSGASSVPSDPARELLALRELQEHRREPSITIEYVP